MSTAEHPVSEGTTAPSVPTLDQWTAPTPLPVPPESFAPPPLTTPAPLTAGPPPKARPVRLDRIVVGLLLAIAGVGWLLDEAGTSVPWRLFPAAALFVIGCALLVSLFAGRGRGALIALGVVTLLLGVAVGVGADRYAGPVGDTVVAPRLADWPVATRLGAGTLTVDLTRYPLPASGTLHADVGAGTVILQLPESGRVAVQASVTMGTLTVDGTKVGDGIDVRWSAPPTVPAATGNTAAGVVTVNVQVGMGEIEVRHD
jgi:hypothetical protein